MWVERIGFGNVCLSKRTSEVNYVNVLNHLYVQLLPSRLYVQTNHG